VYLFPGVMKFTIGFCEEEKTGEFQKLCEDCWNFFVTRGIIFSAHDK
jgi:hypothetical protein